MPDHITIEYRIDKEKLKISSHWFRNKTALSYMNGEHIAQDLYGHKQMIIRVKDDDGFTHTVKFDISGAKEALSEIAKLSGWK